MAKKNRLAPSANSGQPREEAGPAARETERNSAVRTEKSSVSSLSSQTTLARRRAQAEAARDTGREPGTVRRQAGKQVFKVSESGPGGGGGKSGRDKSKKTGQDGKSSLRRTAKGSLEPSVVTDDITEEQLRRLRRIEERERRRRRAAIRRNYIGTRIVMVLFAYLVLTGGIFAALFLYFLPNNNTNQANNYTYQYGPDTGYESRLSVPWNVARYDGNLYIDMTGLAEYCGLAVTGDGVSYRFIVKSSGQYIEFTPGTSDVTVNGAFLKMGAGVCRASGGRIYAPYDFVDRAFLGINLSYNERRRRIIVELDEGQPVFLPFSVAGETGDIPFDSLDVDLQREINDRQIGGEEYVE